MIGGDSGPLGDLHQPLGIAAVAAPHHHQGLCLPGQFLDLGLAGGGGIADGIENLRLGNRATISRTRASNWDSLWVVWATTISLSRSGKWATSSGVETT